MDDWNRFGNSESDERGFIMTDPGCLTVKLQKDR